MKVSIIIRTYNEGENIKKCLDQISIQDYNNYEVILVDSGSTDNTLDIAIKYSFLKIIKITKEEFTFGYSLNRGIMEASGSLYATISGHCFPSDEYWLTNLVNTFKKDKNIGIVYGKQIGDSKYTKFSEHRVFQSWFPDIPNYMQRTSFSNNANCCVRKSIWKKLNGYNESVPGLEDIEFSNRMLRDTKYYLAYEPKACVLHIHKEDWEKIKIRYYREAITYSTINKHETFTLYDFIKLSIINIIHDIKELKRESEYPFIRTIKSIFLFRLNQFWGTYKGFKHTKKNNELRKRFFYPNK